MNKIDNLKANFDQRKFIDPGERVSQMLEGVSVPLFSLKEVKLETIQHILKELPKTHSCGPDEIDGFILNISNEIIAKPLL